MIHIIKQEGFIKTRSTPASFKTVTVKWAIVSGIVTGDVSFSYYRV